MSQPTDAKIDAAFEAANQFIKTSDKNVSLTNADKLQFYALFKQGSVGDCNTSRPGMMDFKASHAWALSVLSIILNVFFSG